MIALLLGLALASDCIVQAPPDQAFEVAAVSASDVLLLLELWPGESEHSWTEEVLSVIEQRGMHATIMLDTVPKGDWAAILARAVERGHVLGLRLDVPVVRRAAEAEPQMWNGLKKPAKETAKATGHRPRVVSGDIPNRPTEALLGAAGYRVQLPTWPDPGSAAHLAARFEGRMGVDVVLPAGPYPTTCTRSAVVGPFTAVTADRASTALRAAVGAANPPIVRVGLDGDKASAHDAAVLGRWLDAVVVPSGAQVVLPETARMAIFGGGRVVADGAATELGGRILSRSDVAAAAHGLDNHRAVPRSLPGEVNPTELFLASLMVLTGEHDEDSIRLGALKGPSSLAKSALSGPIEIEREVVVAMAGQLLGAMPDRIPAALTIGGQPLTAAEMLLLFSTAVTSDRPTTRPIAVPEPNEEGLGWGEATVP